VSLVLPILTNIIGLVPSGGMDEVFDEIIDLSPPSSFVLDRDDSQREI
jgi:hypothetical protein